VFLFSAIFMRKPLVPSQYVEVFNIKYQY